MKAPLRKKERTLGQEEQPTGWYDLVDANNEEMAYELDEADADIILMCVNSHEELTEALRWYVERYPDNPMGKAILAKL